MPARICESCEINFPNTSDFYGRCPICDTNLTYDASHKVEAISGVEAQQILADPIGHRIARLPTSPARENRVERYLHYGFSEIDAHVLADAPAYHRDSKGKLWQRPLDHLDVKRALDAGCTHATAMEVFA